MQVGVDAERLCETSIALRDLALVGATWYKSGLAPSWARGAAPTEDGLLNAPTGTSNRNRSSAWFGLWTNGRGVTGLRAGVLGWKTVGPKLLFDELLRDGTAIRSNTHQGLRGFPQIAVHPEHAPP